MRTLVSFFLIASAAAAACSNSNSSPDGGSDASPTGDGSMMDSNPGTAQTGTVVNLDTSAGVVGANVKGGTATATTDSMGNYSLAETPNTPFTFQLIATPGADGGFSYVSLDEQEWMLTASANRGQTKFVTSTTEAELRAFLPTPAAPDLAVLSVLVMATGTCAGDAGGPDVTGATIHVTTSAGDAGVDAGDAGVGPTVIYFNSSNIPSGSATSVTAGAFPSAIVVNLPPAASFNQITVTHPTCKQKAFPVSDPGVPAIVYTGNVKLEASQPATGPEVVSNIRLFLE